jgi:AcrR family transcriptional regulator
MAGRPRSVSDEAIFDAVARVVNELGPSGLTLAAVAERVGLTAPGVRQRFGNKQSLLVAFAKHQASNAGNEFDTANTPSPSKAIVDGLVASVGAIHTHEALANNLSMLYLDLTDPHLKPHVIEHSRIQRLRIQELVEAAQDANELTSDVVASEIADEVRTIASGALITWATDDYDQPLSQWLAKCINRTLDHYRTHRKT